MKAKKETVPMYILNSLSDKVMKKLVLTFFIIATPLIAVFAQSQEELQTMNNKSKFQFVRPETLDQLMIALRKFETEIERSQDTLLLDTYKNISSAYMANNHFKQAYEVYNKYLNRKEAMLSAYKSDVISKAIQSVSDRLQKNEKEENEGTRLYSLAELKGIRNDADFAK